MQKKRISGNGILDKLHRGAVYTCIGVTLYGSYLLAHRTYNYFYVIKPAREKAELEKLKGLSSDKASELKL